ncbi:OsmC family protein [Neobacillus kokaensis]|uniref:Osmotically inducible protein C n=1 Tax=Neobacillus kokaensis TaxID=2759023 RepID=A0ABQ3N918_9BACI|nr:OsmC family protein [Neobacillus kokaensis]GHH99130.1 osmotically inducible protein C [Neobacillus kokaensis]
MLEYEYKNGVTNHETIYGILPISSDDSKGYRPFELLVSSIVGCSSGVLYKILEKKRMKVEAIRIQSNVERKKEEANKVTEISLHYIIEGTGLKEEQIKKSIEMAFKNCAMVQSVKDSIKISESFEVINH